MVINCYVYNIEFLFFSFLALDYDISLRFSDPFDSALLDTSSQQYKDYSEQATASLKKTIELADGLFIDDTDLAQVVWSFSEGSTIASSHSVPLQGADDRDAVKSAISAVDPSSVDPKLTTITVTGNLIYRTLCITLSHSCNTVQITQNL